MVEPDDDEPEDEPAEPDDVPSPPDVVSEEDELLFSPLSSDDFLPLLAADRRSFFAQPEPLKTIVGGANALRIGPEPHSGHASGAGSFTPWMTSKRRPHAAQM